jgi:hypothetical protein
MKYRFEIENGQICEGYAVLNIVDGLAEAGTPEEIALAEARGGRPAPDGPAEKPARKSQKQEVTGDDSTG